MRFHGWRSMSFRCLLAGLALCACAVDPAGKGEDPDPVVSAGKQDGFSDCASRRGAVDIGVPLLASFDDSSHHLYELELGPGAVVDISVRGEDDPDLDTVLRVYGPAGEQGRLPETRVAYDDDGGPGLSSTIEALDLSAPGTYAVVVSTYAGRPAPGERYLLYVECRVESCSPRPSDLRTIHIELDFLGDVEGDGLLPEAIERIDAVYAQAGIALVFHPDTRIDERVFGFEFDYDEFREVYFDHYQHRGEHGWSYAVMSGLSLQGGINGWGRIGGDMCVLSPNWTRFVGEERLSEQVYIFLHEFGHNLGLTHDGFDPVHPHDHSSCVMPAGRGEGAPATSYCDSCLAHIDPDTEPAWR
ncbi:MAG: hypothetical protein JXR96_26030 [Deltaproteobacteria bacterium]|nr:hypothetical protein [Deltaproteobacteria bacterium]